MTPDERAEFEAIRCELQALKGDYRERSAPLRKVENRIIKRVTSRIAAGRVKAARASHITGDHR